VTLGGQVASDNDKAQGESLAEFLAGAHCRGSRGRGKGSKAVNSDLDGGIEQSLDAALIQNRMHAHVKYHVKNGVVTLTGEVNSEDSRTHAEKGWLPACPTSSKS
jgi:osmotically-inducible protein OsmY